MIKDHEISVNQIFKLTYYVLTKCTDSDITASNSIQLKEIYRVFSIQSHICYFSFIFRMKLLSLYVVFFLLYVLGLALVSIGVANSNTALPTESY